MKYLIFLGLSSIILVTKGFLASYFLGIEQFAFYGIALVWSQIAVLLLPFGSGIKLQLETAENYMQKNVKRIVEDFSQSITLVFVNFVILTFFCYVFYFQEKNLVPSFFGVFLGAIQVLFLVLATLSRCKQDLLFFCKVSLAKAILVVTFIGVLGLTFPNFIGLILAEVAAIFIVLAYIYLRDFKRKSLNLRFLTIRLSWYKDNFSLLAFSLSAILISSFDRLIGSEKLDMVDFASLAFLALFFNAAQMFQAMINSIFLPYLTKIVLIKGVKHLIILSCSLSCIMLLVTIILLYGANELGYFYFKALLNKFNIDIYLLSISSIIFALKASDYVSNVFLILKKELKLIYIRIVIVAMASIYLIVYGSTIKDIINVLLLANLVYYIYTFCGSLMYLDKPHKNNLPQI